jgi:hypothetical protein
MTEGLMSKSIKHFATVILQPSHSARAKRAFLEALSTAVHHDPTIADASLLRVVAQTAAKDKWGAVREDALYTIEAIVFKRAELADASLVARLEQCCASGTDFLRSEDPRNRRSVVEVAKRILKALAEKRPDLIHTLEPDSPGKPTPSATASVPTP